MPRILVLSASVGAGHMRAAQAVELALRELAPEAEIQNTDVLTLTGPLFRRLYGRAYIDLVNIAPHFLGYFYDITDKARTPTPRGDRMRRLVQRVNLPRVISLLHKPWDFVVSTHFLPAQMISLRRRAKKLGLRHATVVTDFDAHAFWVNEPTEAYCVATAEAALSLAHWGVERAKIEVTGIPIHPVFAQHRSAAGCRAKHGLAEDRPVVLLLAGGFGVGPIEKLYRAILEIPRAVHVAAVTGKNAGLKSKLSRVAVPEQHRATVMGFTTEIDELMAAADVVVTKPGGLTTSEVLARGAAMAIVNPIPGQEDRNSDHLLESGAAIKINSLSAVAHKLGSLLGDQERLSRLRAAATAISHPRAAFDVARRVLEMV